MTETIFVIGPQRSGTTWVYRLLEMQEAGIAIDRVEKENYVFSRPRPADPVTRRDRFLARLTGSGPIVLNADVCSTYFGDEAALRRIVESFPNARFIYIHRDEPGRRRSFETHRHYNRFGLWFIGETIGWATYRQQADFAGAEATLHRVVSPDRTLRLDFDDLKVEGGRCWVEALEAFTGVALPKRPEGAVNTARSAESLPRALAIGGYRLVQRLRLHIPVRTLYALLARRG